MDRSALLSMSPAMTRQSASANSDEVKLTLYTRHALRVLTHLAAQPDRLARPAREITLGELVQHTESGLRPGASGPHASVRAQAVEKILDQALTSFFATLDGYSVADIADGHNAGTMLPPDRKSLQ